jgi:predicted SAM-dependent methyltransferase
VKFNQCIRCNDVSKEEKHVCFFCGEEVKQTISLCPDCAQWKCPKCGKCYCSGNIFQKMFLEYIYKNYCCNQLNLLNFTEIKLPNWDVSLDTIDSVKGMIKYANQELTYCSSKLVRLNVGCAMDLKKGYTNVDIQDLKIDDPNIKFVQSDCGKLSFLRDRSVDLVYANQLLEHIHPLDIKEILYEWRRVLKIGGILRIVFPDFEKVIEDYQKCKEFNTTKDFMNFMVLNYVVLNTTQQSDKIRSIFPHKSLQTIKFLTILLESEGFKILQVNNYSDRKYSTEIISERLLRD